jgi:LSD1 subclass zinc finger protein
LSLSIKDGSKSSLAAVDNALAASSDDTRLESRIRGEMPVFPGTIYRLAGKPTSQLMKVRTFFLFPKKWVVGREFIDMAAFDDLLSDRKEKGGADTTLLRFSAVQHIRENGEIKPDSINNVFRIGSEINCSKWRKLLIYIQGASKIACFTYVGFSAMPKMAQMTRYFVQTI